MSKQIVISKSNNSSTMDAIIHPIGLELKALGYRASSRIFNRNQPDGIIHVVHFQMGLRWSIRGRFTIEIGIFVPEVYEAFFGKVTPKFIPSYFCEERERLGVLGKKNEDIWWELSGSEKNVIHEILKLLLDDGERYLAQFGTREKLLSQYEQERQRKALSQRKILMMAIILTHLGKKGQAKDLLNQEFGGQYRTSFLEYAYNIVAPLRITFFMRNE